MPEERILPAVIAEKIAAFERLQPEFESCFQYVQEVQGLRRFPTFPVDASVRYLHALWVCACKDRLLSLPKASERFEGRRCLELLTQWQAGKTADVVEFLQRKLDTLPFAELTRHWEALRRDDQASVVAERVASGRLILLNRGINLLQALDALFMRPAPRVSEEVQMACSHYGHQPAQLTQQVAEWDTARYAVLPHPALARKNMLVMDRVGVQMTAEGQAQPWQHSWRLAAPTLPVGAYAEQVIAGYIPLTASWHNNPIGRRFIDLVEPIRPPTRP